jgi:hypothetical protein
MSARCRESVPWLLLLPLLVAGTRDPGLVLDLDLSDYTLRAVDLRENTGGPELRVVVGSPAHGTPVGVFPVYQVVRNPGWRPGETARRYGARPIPPSSDGPLGVAKLPFARDGIALHGAANPILVGKPASLGCVRALDAELTELLDWLGERGALGSERPQPDGERHQTFLRPVRIVVH